MKKNFFFWQKLIVLVAVTIGILSGSASLASAQKLFDWWTDSWSNGALYTTNFERNSFNTYILRTDDKFGINLIPLWGESYVMPYVAVAANYSPDPNYWNSRYYGGLGVRVLPFAGGKNDTLLSKVKLFCESLSAGYFKDASNAEVAGAPSQDTSFGIDIYYENNQPQYHGDKNYDYKSPWFEMWTNLAYRQTYFTRTDFNSYVFRFQPKMGLYLGANPKNPPRFEPYVTLDMTYSGRDDYWLNRANYGLGFRIQPFRYIKNDTTAWLYKFKTFVEIWGTSYLKTAPTDKPSMDLRGGVEFTIGR